MKSLYKHVDHNLDQDVREKQFLIDNRMPFKKKQTQAQINLVKCEQKVAKKFKQESLMFQTQDVTKTFYKSSVDKNGKDLRQNREKLKGAFKLSINHDLPMPKKIERYCAEPVVFYLHKNRNFIRKLQLSKEEADRQKYLQKYKMSNPSTPSMNLFNQKMN